MKTYIYLFNMQFNYKNLSNFLFWRLGGIAAPILAAMDKKMALIIMGVCSLIAGILAIILPETLGSKLPETISEVSYDFRP